MYKEGHAGLSFLLFSPFILLFKSLGVDMTYILITCVLMVTLSSLPDLDMEFRVYGIKHRGITHTLLGAIFFGVAFAILIGYAYGSIGWLMGFIAGFGGTVSHLLGDVFTYTSFKPLYPFSKKEVALGYFKASNKTINNAMLTLGIMTFIISLVIA
jgi:inner membrane protein